MAGNRKDDNQKAIEQFVRDIGGHFIDCTGDTRLGFDGLILYRGRTYITEVKDGSKPPSRRRLTDNEERRKACVEATGNAYYVVETVNDVMAMLGL